MLCGERLWKLRGMFICCIHPDGFDFSRVYVDADALAFAPTPSVGFRERAPARERVFPRPRLYLHLGRISKEEEEIRRQIGRESERIESRMSIYRRRRLNRLRAARLEKNRRVYTRRMKKKRTFTCAYTSVEKKKEATREKNERKGR